MPVPGGASAPAVVVVGFGGCPGFGSQPARAAATPTDAGLRAVEGHGGAVTLIQRFGSATNLNIHLHCLVPDGV